MGACVGFAQGDPLALQSNPKVSVSCSVVVLSTLVGISVNRNYLEACDRCNLVSADTASLASPAMSVSREIASKNVPAALAKLMRLAP